MVAELRDDHMGQQTRSGKAALDRPRWRRCFNHAIAACAGELRPHMADDLEAVGDVLELFRDIVTEVPQLAAAIRTAIAVRSVRDHFAREMLRQRLALRSCLRFFSRGNSFGPASISAWVVSSSSSSKLQLLKLDDDLLALRAEDHVPQLLDHELHVLDPLAA